MSHDGISFVTKEQLERQKNAPPKLTGDAIIPAKVRVDMSGGTGMEIDWRDGHASRWTFPWLRNACPCATCHEERDADGREPGTPKPEPPTLLPMYKAVARPTSVVPVGKYALQFKWNDGHEAGLYSWDYLRNVCDRRVAEGADFSQPMKTAE